MHIPVPQRGGVRSAIPNAAAPASKVPCATRRGVQGALEVLLAAAGGPIEASVEAAEPSHPYSLTCAAIVQDAGSLQLMLELLETEAPLTEDFYVRHSSVQLLSRLVCASPETLQAAVLDRQQVRSQWPVAVGESDCRLRMLMPGMRCGAHTRTRPVATAQTR